MKVTLKNVYFSERLSEETNAFTADVYVDGKKVGYAKNDGHGGCTFVQPYSETKKVFNECEDYLKTQPQLNIGSDENPFMIDCNMESMVDYLFEKWLKEKEEKKIQNHCKKGVVFNTPNGYSIISWKNSTIEGMLKNPVMTQRLQKVVTDLKNEGKQIVNKNLPEEWFN